MKIKRKKKWTKGNLSKRQTFFIALRIGNQRWAMKRWSFFRSHSFFCQISFHLKTIAENFRSSVSISFHFSFFQLLVSEELSNEAKTKSKRGRQGSKAEHVFSFFSTFFVSGFSALFLSHFLHCQLPLSFFLFLYFVHLHREVSFFFLKHFWNIFSTFWNNFLLVRLLLLFSFLSSLRLGKKSFLLLYNFVSKWICFQRQYEETNG